MDLSIKNITNTNIHRNIVFQGKFDPATMNVLVDEVAKTGKKGQKYFARLSDKKVSKIGFNDTSVSFSFKKLMNDTKKIVFEVTSTLEGSEANGKSKYTFKPEGFVFANISRLMKSLKKATKNIKYHEASIKAQAEDFAEKVELKNSKIFPSIENSEAEEFIAPNENLR